MKACAPKTSEAYHTTHYNSREAALAPAKLPSLRSAQIKANMSDRLYFSSDFGLRSPGHCCCLRNTNTRQFYWVFLSRTPPRQHENSRDPVLSRPVGNGILARVETLPSTRPMIPFPTGLDNTGSRELSCWRGDVRERDTR